MGEILERAKEILEIEEEMIKEGKIPESRRDPPIVPLKLDDDLERSFSIVTRLIKKCKELIKFNIERNEPEQKQLSIKEF